MRARNRFLLSQPPTEEEGSRFIHFTFSLNRELEPGYNMHTIPLPAASAIRCSGDIFMLEYFRDKIYRKYHLESNPSSRAVPKLKQENGFTTAPRSLRASRSFATKITEHHTRSIKYGGHSHKLCAAGA